MARKLRERIELNFHFNHATTTGGLKAHFRWRWYLPVNHWLARTHNIQTRKGRGKRIEETCRRAIQMIYDFLLVEALSCIPNIQKSDCHFVCRCRSLGVMSWRRWISTTQSNCKQSKSDESGKWRGMLHAADRKRRLNLLVSQIFASERLVCSWRSEEAETAK